MADSTAVFPPGHRITATSGVPIPAAYVKFYVAGTDTLKEVFADADLTVSLGSTVYYDSYGYSVTAEGGTTKTLVYTDTEAYKIVGYDENDNIVFSHDNVRGALVATADTASGITQDQADLRYVRNPNALSEVTVLASGDKFGIYDASSAGNRGIDYDNVYANLLATMQTAGDVFASGPRLAFQQTTPPTGWVKETGAAYNDASPKITTGTVATGGSVAYSDLFQSQTLTGTIGNTTLSSGNNGPHTHVYGNARTVDVNLSGFTDAVDKGTAQTTFTTASSGSGTAFAPALTMNAFDMEVKFAEFSIGQKS